MHLYLTRFYTLATKTFKFYINLTLDLFGDPVIWLESVQVLSLLEHVLKFKDQPCICAYFSEELTFAAENFCKEILYIIRLISSSFSL